MLAVFKGIYAATLLVAITAIPASAQPASEMPENVQTMSFKVSIDGREVMAPILGMPSAGRAEVSVGTGDRDGYTLGVNVMKAAQSNELLPLKLRLELWRGSSHTGMQLLDQIMEVTAADSADKPRSVEAVHMRGGTRERVLIELISLDSRRADNWPAP